MTVTQLTNRLAGETLQDPIHKQQTEQNSILAGCNVHFLFRNHAIDLETGRHGIRWLIYRVLSENEAVFPIFKNVNRNIYLAFGLTTGQIINRVRQYNGFDRYPNKTIVQYLSVIMRKDGQVASIRMAKNEDKNRQCKVPRKRWYIVQD